MTLSARTKHLVHLAAGAALAFSLAACGSSEATSDNASSGLADQSSATTGADQSDDAEAAPEGDAAADEGQAPTPQLDATCNVVPAETTGTGFDEITIDFVAPSAEAMDYWIVVAEPDGSNDSTFKLTNVGAGQAVSYSTNMVGGPESCEVTQLDPASPDTSNLEEAGACTLVRADGRYEVGAEITNAGSEPANYTAMATLFDASGTLRFEQTLQLIDGIEPGATGTANGLTNEIPEDDYSCEVIWVFKK